MKQRIKVLTLAVDDLDPLEQAMACTKAAATGYRGTLRIALT